jgi:hypothetical protein
MSSPGGRTRWWSSISGRARRTSTAWRTTPSSSATSRRLPNSQLVLYPDAGHGGVFQFHEDFVKRTLEFL